VALEATPLLTCCLAPAWCSVAWQLAMGQDTGVDAAKSYVSHSVSAAVGAL
ncbi:hypothetical protein HispidOSU_018196, partial [Sigmodon hispidus]